MASPPIVEDSDIAARRAKTRIGVAVVLLAIAIGGLALLSRHKPEKSAEESVPSEKQESISSGQTPETPAQINSAQQEAAPPPPPTTPEAPAETPVEPPPPPPPAPVVGKLPPEPAHSAAPATPRSVTPAEKPEKPAPLAPSASQPAKQEPAATKPAPEKPASTPTPAKAEPKSYEVQVGVFTDMENAKQLQAKLAEHGIPSHTETKLQIGPFANKAEADAAQAKLKALGMGAVIVPGK